tara:strand:+ start:3347 stop:3559 length:213 start_codon:yes stop_codon:yes gene_type:complete
MSKGRGHAGGQSNFHKTKDREKTSYYHDVYYGLSSSVTKACDAFFKSRNMDPLRYNEIKTSNSKKQNKDK